MSKAKAVSYGFVGRCIYCLSEEGDLTDEHVYPAGLGGDRILEKATCTACQREINQNVEQICLRGLFRDIRYRRSIGSRGLKERPQVLDIRVPKHPEAASSAKVDLGDWERVSVPRVDHPSVLFLPIYDAPRIVSGISKDSPEPHPRMWHYIEPSDMEGPWLMSTKFNAVVFNRLLAKIAHGFAVMEFGLDGFTPFLNDLIRGKDVTNSLYFVGCDRETRDSGTDPYFLGLAIMRAPIPDLILVHIRMFSDLGAPPYLVAVGKRTRP